MQGHSPASAAGCGCVNGTIPIVASHATSGTASEMQGDGARMSSLSARLQYCRAKTGTCSKEIPSKRRGDQKQCYYPKEDPFNPQEWQPLLPPTYPQKHISSYKRDAFQSQNSRQNTALWKEGYQLQKRVIRGQKVGLSAVRMWLKCWCHLNWRGPHTATWLEICCAQSDQVSWQG